VPSTSSRWASVCGRARRKVSSTVWTSPLGRVYHTQPQPITTDLPDPLPGPPLPKPPLPEPEYPDAPPAASHNEHGPIFYRPPPPPDPPPAPAPAGDPNEPPPF
jgi:hypothetical protein